MKEYILIKHQEEDGQQLFILMPLSPTTPGYGLLFKDSAKAHEYKLALGLGTFPTLKQAPQNYQLITDVKFNEIDLYEIIVERDNSNDTMAPHCCKSGCDGCPWTIEQIRLGKL